MKEGFTVINAKIFDKPECIVVSNYVTENEVLNWPCYLKVPVRTRSDIGMWRIKYKANA